MSTLDGDPRVSQLAEPCLLETLIAEELKLEILRFIRSSSDLKALCLTSKSWQLRAVPLLYRRIEINPRLKVETERFKASVAAGAAVHLKYTRSLSFIDSKTPPAVQRSTLTGIPESLYPESWNWQFSTNEMKVEVERISKLFPDNVLTTFRFLSPKSPPDGLISTIRQGQKGIEHFHMTLFRPQHTVEFHSADIGPVPSICSLFYQARTLELRMGCLSDVNVFVRTRDLLLSGATQKLERLSLWGYHSSEFACFESPEDALMVEDFVDGGDDDYQMDMMWYLWTHQTSSIATVKHEKLRQLSLRKLNVVHHSWLLGLVDVTRLTHLTLWDCPGVEHFLRSVFDGIGPLSLKHVAIGVPDGHPSSDRSFLEPLLQACQTLQSLHLQVMTTESLDCTVSSLREGIGQRLRSLGLETHKRWNDCLPLLEVREFEQLCMVCPRLEQLGYRVKNDVNPNRYPREWTAKTLQDIFAQLAPLSYLRNLKILHLRQSSFEHWEPTVFRDIAATQRVFNHQYFANSFFAWLEKYDICPELKILVLGSLGPMPQQYTRNPGMMQCNEIIPQQCFVRSKQADRYGGSRVVGLPMPLELLRREDPETLSILDYDPTTSWPGREVGRLNDI